jgi:hypothetical protein
MRPDIRATPDVRELDCEPDKVEIRSHPTLGKDGVRNAFHKAFLVLGWVAILYMLLLPFQRFFGQ